MTPGKFRLPSCRVANKPLLHDFFKWPREAQLSTFQKLGSGVLLQGMCLCGKLANVAGLRCSFSWYNIAASRHLLLRNLTSRLPLEGNAPMHLPHFDPPDRSKLSRSTDGTLCYDTDRKMCALCNQVRFCPTLLQLSYEVIITSLDDGFLFSSQWRKGVIG
jgi:hypothetical protein